MIVLFNGAELTALRKSIKGYAGWLYPQPRFWGVPRSSRAAPCWVTSQDGWQ